MPAQDKPVEKEKQNFYIGLYEPADVRRNLLESMKGLIQLMQRYEKFKEVRQEKDEVQKQLRDKVREISSLCNELRQELPKLKMPKEEIDRIKRLIEEERKSLKTAPAAPQPAKKDDRKKQVADQKQPEEPISEIDRLERQLTSIESQLKGLK